MTKPTLKRLAGTGAVVTTLLAASGSVLAIVDTGDPSLVPFGLTVSVFAVLGSVVVNRLPRHAVGWWMLGLGISAAFGAWAQPYADMGGWGSQWVALAAAAGSDIAAPFCLGMVILYFPGAHLPSARWRTFFRTVVSIAGVTVMAKLFAPGVISDFGPSNPLGIAGAEALETVGEAAMSLLLLLVFGPAVGSLLWRLWHSAGVERAQIKWFAYAALLLIIVLTGSELIPLLVGRGTTVALVIDVGFVVGLASMPLAIAAAILRYRLFDIDRIVSRTLSYGMVTAFLVVTYLGAVFALRLFVPTQGDLAVAASTLAVAALFNPLPRRVQGAVDRRFARSRYDVARIIDEFGERLRTESGLHTLAGELAVVAATTMQPPTVSLWLRDEEGT